MVLDFSSNSALIWALLPEILLSGGAMVVLLAGVFASPSKKDDPQEANRLAWIAMAGIALAAIANGWLYGVTVSSQSPMVAVDSFRLFANWLFLGGAAFSILISTSYVARQRLQTGEFYTMVLLATVGMMVMVASRDLILLFLGIETMSIAAFVLTAFNRRDRRSAEAGLKYFLLGALASAFLLYGIALTWGGTGSANFAVIAEVIRSGGGVPILVLLGMGLLAIGFAFKIAAVPFHMWTPDVYEGAPTPVTAFMSAAVKAASFLALARLFLEAFPALHETWSMAFFWLAALTMIVPNLVALSQSSVKRMLAYSSVAHGGYLLVALTAANAQGTAGLLFYLLVYTVMNIGALGVVLLVSGHSEDSVELDDYAGFGWRQPLFGVVFTIFLLSLAGFPGTGGFIGKIHLLQGAVDAGLWNLAIVLALVTVVSYFYYLRVAWFMWMRPSPEGVEDRGVWAPVPLQAALVVAALFVVYLGIFPSALLDAAKVAGASILSVVGGIPVGMSGP
jgi:NADH-quinone oxidoreductase subunit N